ncbi:unnamed protein product [Adineta steineri]|uniref:ARMC9 CTLH-like domain-containing protein n=1 Tax=Adineta steineri TaxID=433720 RepID=A0A818QQ25_9BILA|nr:unnamed protein product [Adineta steineri]
MATSFTIIDDLVRDYFQYRNLSSTSRTFDNELIKLPIEQYRADHIIEQLTLNIHQFDLTTLIDYWTQIEQRLLSNLTIDSQKLINIFTKIRTNLYRCYLIHAIQSSKTDKINEFFDRLIKTLQQSNDWSKEWFTLPFIKNPKENPVFQVYFSKQWSELFWASLQNFLSIAFFHMIPSKIGSIKEQTDLSISSPELTIISKLRNKFLPNQIVSSNSELPSFSTPSESIFVQPVQESTIGNQIFLSTDDSSSSQISIKSTTIM